MDSTDEPVIEYLYDPEEGRYAFEDTINELRNSLIKIKDHKGRVLKKCRLGGHISMVSPFQDRCPLANCNSILDEDEASMEEYIKKQNEEREHEIELLEELQERYRKQYEGNK